MFVHKIPGEHCAHLALCTRRSQPLPGGTLWPFAAALRIAGLGQVAGAIHDEIQKQGALLWWLAWLLLYHSRLAPSCRHHVTATATITTPIITTISSTASTTTATTIIIHYHFPGKCKGGEVIKRDEALQFRPND